MSDARAEIPIRLRDGILEVDEGTPHEGILRPPIIEWHFKQGNESEEAVDPERVKFRITGITPPECRGETPPPPVPFRLPGNPRSVEEALEIFAEKEYDFVEKPLRLRAKRSAFPSGCGCPRHEYHLDVQVASKDQAPDAGGGSFDPHIIFEDGDEFDPDHDPEP